MDVERERIPEETSQDDLTKWLEEERERLESLRSTLEQQVFGEGQEGSTGELTVVDQHPADTADLLEARERAVALENMLTERRKQIDLALERLAKGQYGLCERCGNRINPERLRAKPDAIYCIDCQRLLERRRPAA